MKLTKQQALDKIEELKNYINSGEIESIIPMILNPDIQHPYSDKVLEECAAENEKGEKWRLIYINGYSLAELKQKHSDFFYGQSWYDNEKFINDKSGSGYYLLNFNKNFTNKIWLEQEKELQNKGLGRANLSVVIEAMIALKEIKNEILLQDWYHWSSSRDSDGYLVVFGMTDSKGAYLRRWDPRYSGDYVGVVSVR